MSNIYEWLFDHYALLKLRDLESEHIDALAAYTDRVTLSQRERLQLHDMVGSMRLDWGAAAFALGVRFGLRLSCPYTRTEKTGWLMDFLP